MAMIFGISKTLVPGERCIPDRQIDDFRKGGWISMGPCVGGLMMDKPSAEVGLSDDIGIGSGIGIGIGITIAILSVWALYMKFGRN